MPEMRSASISEITNKGRRFFRLDLGKNENGKRKTHDFHSRDSAETFKKICEEAWAKGLATPVADLGLPAASSPAKLYEIPNESGTITYRITYSIKGGKRYQRG